MTILEPTSDKGARKQTRHNITMIFLKKKKKNQLKCLIGDCLCLTHIEQLNGNEQVKMI